MLSAPPKMLAVPALACLLCLSRPAAANLQTGAADRASKQANAQSAPLPELYRLRLTNTVYGAVEVSADRGATWTLIARVAKPAEDSAPAGASTLPVVQRASKEGVSVGVGSGRAIRLLPYSQLGFRDPCAVVTNVAATSDLFADLLPPPGSPVQLLTASGPSPVPGGYRPREDDRLLVTVQQSAVPAGTLPAVVKAAGAHYILVAANKLKTANRKPTSGFLSLNASTAPGEKAAAVTFLLDGAVVAIVNRPPYTLRLNTKNWPNGEHLIEVRALDSNGSTVTRKKALVVVDNPV